MGKLIFEQESYAIRGAAMEVHNEMGCGFLEPVFQECLEMLFTEKEIPFESQKELPIKFRDRALRKKYIADFVCCGSIIVELKTVRAITDVERAQTINYLKATGFRLGLLINFNPNGKLEIERVVL